jgi:SAM-dependent methyltransferase
MGEIFKRPMPAANLPFTGERLTPELTGQAEIEHLHRYFLARHMCRGKDVLDVASGEGYGSALLAQVAKSVVGVELAEDVVAHANTEYRQPNVCFWQGDARELPIPDASIDVAVSFETIEHFDGHDRFLSEIRRVLRPGGRLVISTPDRDHYSPTGAPANPFHVLEMTRSEFSALLSRHFAHVVLALQRPMIGSVMLASEVGGALEPLCFEKRGDHIEFSNGLGRPQYAVGIASDQPIEPLPATVYIETSLLGAREQELRAEGAAQRAAAESAEVEALRHRADTFAAERDAAQGSLAELQREVDALRAEVAGLRHANERAEEACAVVRHQLDAERAHVIHLQGEVSALLASRSWRVTAPLRTLVRFGRGRAGPHL